MKAISLWQPWASAIALGVKCIETRGWRTNHVGPIAICAAQHRAPELRDIFEDLLDEHDDARWAFADALDTVYDTLPFGRVVAVADLTRCVPVAELGDISEMERAFGNYADGRFGWVFGQITRLREPVPVSGRQQLFNLPAAVEAAVRGQLSEVSGQRSEDGV